MTAEHSWEALWTAAAAAEAMGGRLSGAWSADGQTPIGGLSIDSRNLKPGDLFVALAGAARDGHDFIGGALAAGAAGALAARRPDGVSETAPLIFVEDDTLAALERLGVAGRARAADLFAIAVTGSAGKTTVKDMLRTMAVAALGDAARVHAAAKSFNNHIGVPLTLAETPPHTRIGVYEIGMNNPGEIAPLSRMARPDAVMVTTVAPAHLEAFDSVDGIAQEKASIIEGASAGAAAIFNRDIPYFERMAARARARGLEVVDFGETAAAARLVSSVLERDAQLVSCEIFGEALDFRIGAPGRHLAMNATAALAALAKAGAPLGLAAAALAEWTPPSGRGARALIKLPGGGEALLVDESYNANPASVRAALGSFAAQQPGSGGRRIAFLTDMLELGPAAAQLHAELAEAIVAAKVDSLHVAGPLMGALFDVVPADVRGERHDDAETLAAHAARLIGPGDAIFVKGSLGSKAHRIAAALKAAGG